MNYNSPQILAKNLGNNTFAWEERMKKYGKSPTLTIPSLIEGDIGDVQIGEDIVFEEVEDGVLRSCKGLRNFVRIKTKYKEDIKSINSKSGVWGEGTVGTVMMNSTTNSEASDEGVGLPTNAFGTFGNKSTEEREKSISSHGDAETSSAGRRKQDSCMRRNDRNGDAYSMTKKKNLNNQEIIIFDNHNHALYFWIDAIRRGIIEPGCELIHIDEHSDLWPNENTFDLKMALENEKYAWRFSNLSCNVGNYIDPALKSGLIGKMIRIENEYQIDKYRDYIPSSNCILNIDLDIFASELDHIPERKKIQIIQNLLQHVRCVTIATSPYFIDQGKAIERLNNILQNVQ